MKKVLIHFDIYNNHISLGKKESGTTYFSSVHLGQFREFNKIYRGRRRE